MSDDEIHDQRVELVQRLGDILSGVPIAVVVPALASLIVGWCKNEDDFSYTCEVLDAAIESRCANAEAIGRVH